MVFNKSSKTFSLIREITVEVNVGGWVWSSEKNSEFRKKNFFSLNKEENPGNNEVKNCKNGKKKERKKKTNVERISNELRWD